MQELLKEFEQYYIDNGFEQIEKTKLQLICEKIGLSTVLVGCFLFGYAIIMNCIKEIKELLKQL